MSQEMKESRCPFPPEPLAVPIKMGQEQTPRMYNNNDSHDMLPPPPYSVQRTEDDGGLMTPRALSRIHGSAEKNQHEDHVIVMHSDSHNNNINTSTMMNDQSASGSSNIHGHHGVRRVSLPVTGASTPGNSMAPPHSITPPTGNHHVHHSSSADEILGAPPIEDDPITLGVGGSGSSNNHDGSSSSSHQHRHHHHYHRVSLPETI
jgi:hypothetical protein